MKKADVMKNRITLRQEQQAWYVTAFNQFEEQLNGDTNASIHTIRKDAIARFSQLGFPHLRQEEWRYTDITPLLQHRFHLSSGRTRISGIHIEDFLFEGLDTYRMAFVNGCYSEPLSTVDGLPPGLLIDPFERGMALHPELIENYFASIADYREEPFTALNTAFTSSGSIIRVRKNCQIQTPIHLLYLSSAEEGTYMMSPRNLLIAEENSEITLIESSYSLNNHVHFTNLVSEMILKENATVNYLSIQNEGKSSFRFNTVQVHQANHTRFRSLGIDLGGRLVRNNLKVVLDGEDGECELSGFSLSTGEQVIDNHTYVDHSRPGCRSNEMYKGILDGKSRGVFSGTVLVRPDAQKTQALYQNKNLLLSQDAVVNSKPQLKIFADDVRCSHGATIGQLDEEAVFYLQQRGIDRERAISLLRYAFAADVFNKIPLDPVRVKVDQLVLEKFNQAKGGDHEPGK